MSEVQLLLALSEKRPLRWEDQDDGVTDIEELRKLFQKHLLAEDE